MPKVIVEDVDFIECTNPYSSGNMVLAFEANQSKTVIGKNSEIFFKFRYHIPV
jgi:hypothetical protein